MNSKSIVGGLAALTLCIAAVSHAGGHLPSEKRQAAMKANGGFAKTLGGYAKGETAYDAAKVMAALQGMKGSTAGFTDMFPDGSDTGKTKAAPAIFSDRAGFNAAFAKYEAAVDAAIAASPGSQAELASVFGQIGQTCGGCHESYRLK